MDVQEMISRMQDAATVKRVYGDAYEKDSVTIIPTARVSARGGSGAARGGEHFGGGFRVTSLLPTDGPTRGLEVGPLVPLREAPSS